MHADHVRRAALAVAVLSAVGAIAASAASSTTATTLPSGYLSADGGASSGPSGVLGATAATTVTGSTGSSGATGTTGATGSTGSSAGAGQGSSGASSTPVVTPSGGTTPGAPAGSTGAGGVGGPGTGVPIAVGTGGSSAGSFVAPVVTSTQAQPQSGTAAAPASTGSKHHAAGGGASSSGPTAPSPTIFGGPDPLAGVLPGSWSDPFIVNGAADVPAFYVQSFHIPPFLLSIYQAAGAAYDIPWQTLAAINEVETDYGTDLDTSSAGAIGWMQFLPATWRRYGVDASASGARDPYNAADAIFAAARFLAAAGGTHNLAGAIFAYNHSHAYVRSVLLRAELLTGEPSALVNSVSELAEGDFPIQLRYHASYAPASEKPPSSASRTTAAAGGSAPSPAAVGAAAAASAHSTPAADIFASPGAAVVAAQDATVVAIGHSRELGRYVVLRNAFGDHFTYGNLGSVSAWYPARKPAHPSAALLSTAAPAGLAPGPHPSSPATAGAQSAASRPSSSLFRRGVRESEASAASTPTVDTFNLRSRPSAATLFAPLAVLIRAARTAVVHVHHAALVHYFTGAFGLRPGQLELVPLRVGSHVLAGTILGRLGHPADGRRPHLVFELRPAGSSETPIDPRAFLDSWSQLETLELHRDSFISPFYGPNLHPASVGTLLLSSQLDLERTVLEDTRVTLPACERTAIADGDVDRRVLATLEILVVHGLDPTVSAAGCAAHRPAAPAILRTPNALALVALGGHPIAQVASLAIHALQTLHGAARPTLSEHTLAGELVVAYAPDREPQALAAAAAFTTGFALSPARWVQLDERLLEIREPRVPTAVSPAALAVQPVRRDARRRSAA